jgi:hypothetical protein
MNPSTPRFRGKFDENPIDARQGFVHHEKRRGERNCREIGASSEAPPPAWHGRKRADGPKLTFP